MASPNVAAPDTYSAVRRFSDRPYWPEVALFALTVLCFVMTVGFGFIYDDRVSVINNGTNDWAGVSTCFTANTTAMHGSDLYRPVSCSVQRVNLFLIDHQPSAWHLLSVLLHALNTLLVFRFAKRLLQDNYMALVAGALFAVHPVHLEPVSWISAFADPLMTLFLLVSAMMWSRWAERESSIWWVGAFAAGSIAVLCKEPAVMLPLLLMCSAFAIPAQKRRSIPVLAAGVLPFVAIDIAYLIVRHRVLNVVLAHGGGAVATSTAEMFYTLPSVVWFYLKQLVAPTTVSLFYPLGPQHTWKSSGFIVALLSVSAVCAVVVALIQRSERRVQLWVAVAWMVLPLAPLLYLKAFVKFEFVHDRFLYAPSIGFCMLAATALIGAASALHPRSTRAKVVIPSLVIALGIVITIANEPVFRNDVTVFTRAFSVTPDNPDAVIDLGTALLEQKEYAQGIPLIERAIKLRPTDSLPIFNRARAAWEQGDNVTAERYLVRALDLQLSPEYLVQFVSIEMRLRKFDNAEAAAREALRIDPKVANGHLALGAVLLERGDQKGAEAEFLKQLELEPQNRAAMIGLQRLGQR